MFERIKELIETLNYNTKLYDEGHPTMTDEEWDKLYFELCGLELESGMYFADSPTQKVNYQVVNELSKVKHNHPMLSLQKTQSIDDIVDFIGKKEPIIMLKIDGLTCSLTYENGQLIAAETRGDGEIGEDILHNALVVSNIPNKIPFKGRLVVDGEIICKHDAFTAYIEYKNPRNFASVVLDCLIQKSVEPDI
jgi:DNA ligase (NAD+)